MSTSLRLVLVGALALALGVRLWPWWVDSNARIEAETVQVRRRAAWLAELASGAQATAALDTHRVLAEAAARSFLVPIGDDRGVSALSSIIAQYAEDAGLVLGPVRIASTEHPVLEASASGDLSGVMQFLLLVEQGTPRLHVTALTIAASRPEPQPETETLELRFRVQGYLRSEVAGMLPRPTTLAAAFGAGNR